MGERRVLKFITYEVERPNEPFRYKLVDVVTGKDQRAKAPEKGAKRLYCFYGVTYDSDEELIKKGYIIQFKVA